MSLRFGFAAVLLCCFGLLAGGATAFAADKSLESEIKIGVIDVQGAIALTKEGKAAQKKLDDMGASKRKDIEDKTSKIKAMEEELKKQLPLMNEKAKQEKLAVYQELAADLQKVYLESQNELAKEESELLDPIMKKMNDIITQMAMEYGYTLILNKNAGVLYHTPQLDLTHELVKRFNKK